MINTVKILAQFSILIVDDDAAFRKGLAASLRSLGCSVDLACNGAEALDYVRQHPIDVVLLDMNMPRMGGVEACQRIRAVAVTPQAAILMLTVRDTEDDKVDALYAGADDYITKPFSIRELIARMRSARRWATSGPLQAGELELDLRHRRLRKGGTEIRLTPKEFQLLAYLMQHPDIPVPHAKILEAVWGEEYGPRTDYLRSYVKSLRRKIEDKPAQPEYIITEPWLGYRLQIPARLLPLESRDPKSN